jgi:hypothetical protein
VCAGTDEIKKTKQERKMDILSFKRIFDGKTANIAVSSDSGRPLGDFVVFNSVTQKNEPHIVYPDGTIWCVVGDGSYYADCVLVGKMELGEIHFSKCRDKNTYAQLAHAVSCNDITSRELAAAGAGVMGGRTL